MDNLLEATYDDQNDKNEEGFDYVQPAIEQ
jgi:hypothetical protein